MNMNELAVSLKKEFPLLEFIPQENHVVVKNKNSQFWIKEKFDRIDKVIQEHLIVSLKKELNRMYPNLYFGIYISKTTISISVWVMVDGRDGTSTGKSFVITQVDLHERLKLLNEEAHKSKQEGWFFCTGHGRAEQIEEYDYWCFTGKFCKQFSEEFPEQKRSALNERYN